MGMRCSCIICRLEREGYTLWEMAQMFRGDIIAYFEKCFRKRPADTQHLRYNIRKMLPYLIIHWPKQLIHYMPDWTAKAPRNSEMLLTMLSLTALNYSQVKLYGPTEECLQELEMASKRLETSEGLGYLAARYLRNIALIRVQMHLSGYHLMDRDWVEKQVQRIIIPVEDRLEAPIYHMLVDETLAKLFVHQLSCEGADAPQERRLFIHDKVRQIMSRAAINREIAYRCRQN